MGCEGVEIQVVAHIRVVSLGARIPVDAGRILGDRIDTERRVEYPSGAQDVATDFFDDGRHEVHHHHMYLARRVVGGLGEGDVHEGLLVAPTDTIALEIGGDDDG